MLEKEFSEFSVKLQQFPKTQLFFNANKKLRLDVEKVEFKNGDYYFKNSK